MPQATPFSTYFFFRPLVVLDRAPNCTKGSSIFPAISPAPHFLRFLHYGRDKQSQDQHNKLNNATGPEYMCRNPPSASSVNRLLCSASKTLQPIVTSIVIRSTKGKSLQSYRGRIENYSKPFEQRYFFFCTVVLAFTMMMMTMIVNVKRPK